MSYDVVLKNGLIVTPTGVIQGGVAIDGEKIVGVGADPTLGSGKQKVDLKGKILFPGCFDPHVHFGISGKMGDEAMVEDFLHDSKDCLVGGVTTTHVVWDLQERLTRQLYGDVLVGLETECTK